MADADMRDRLAAEIEITPEMIEAVDGVNVSYEDLPDRRGAGYSKIFAGMLMSSSDPRLTAIKRVVFPNGSLVRREES
jgi:hypothetical protein